MAHSTYDQHTGIVLVSLGHNHVHGMPEQLEALARAIRWEDEERLTLRLNASTAASHEALGAN